MLRKCVFGASSLAVVCGVAGAQVQDFEGFDLGGADFLDTAESLLFEDLVPSIDMTIVGGADLRVYDLLEWAGSDPGNHGQALIDWDWNSESNDVGTEFLFSAPIPGFSLLAGDYGGDEDGPLTITAYDADGAIVATDSVFWTGDDQPPFAQLSLTGTGITCVVYTSGGDFTGSTFIDDVMVIPAPGATGVLALAAVLGMRRRRD